MNKLENTNLIRTEKGVSVLIFSFTIVALFAFIALAIDSANLFLASTKMQNIGDSANMTALNIRIERGPQMRNATGSDKYACDFISPDGTKVIYESCVKDIILPVAGAVLKQNLKLMGFTNLSGPTAGGPNGSYLITKGTEFTAEINYIDCRTGTNASDCINPDTGTPLSPTELTNKNEFEYFTTKITYDVPLLLMHTVPFGLLGINAPVVGSTFELTSTSQAILPALNVAILADISGSMKDPSGGRLKIDSLREALTNFINDFRPDRDKISFWPYNLQVSPDQSVPVTPDINDGFDLAGMQAKIDDLTELKAKGNTNPSDALLAAYEDFLTHGGGGSAKAGIIDNLESGTKGEYTMVLFSDGAPTAMTAQFAQYDSSNYTAVFEVGMQNTDFYGSNDLDNPDYLTGSTIARAQTGTCASYDAQHNCLTYTTTDNTTPTTSSTTVYTWGMPSPFYRTSIVRPDTGVQCESASIGSNFGRLFNKTDYDQVRDKCNSTVNVNPSSPINCPGYTNTGNIQSDARCLDYAYPSGTNAGSYLGFSLPSTTVPISGLNGTIFADEPAFRLQTDQGKASANGTTTIHPIGFKKQFYNNLIAMSDFIRSQKGYIYTVGVGTLGNPSDPNDPYQEVRDNSSLKTNLLGRVAADDTVVAHEFGFKNPFVGTGTCSGPTGSAPSYTTDPVTTNCGNAWRGHPRKGESINTDNGTNLDRIFQRIARQLQTKVVVDPKSRTGGSARP